MLSGNQISSIPDEISNCTNLELVRLSSNQLKDPPMEILKLPNLAWVAMSDNPFLDSITEAKKLAVLPSTTSSSSSSSSSLKVFSNDILDDPTQGQILGKGASGITRQFTIPDTNQVVAVKEFFSNITSDGNPQVERIISFTTATLIQSKSLIQVLGQTKKGNLVMEVLSNYQVLANPPSLQSCSRDVYDHYYQDGANDVDVNINDATNADTDKVKKFVTLPRMIHLVQNLLYTLKELHVKCSITHGDFYGHNILCSKTDESQIWLTDFGAAFFYDRESEYGTLLELIERRAFSHLLGEVMDLMKLINVDANVDADADAGVDTTSNPDDGVTGLKTVLKELIDSHEEQSFEQLYSIWTNYYSKLEC
jgi:hypothetical protein